MEVMDSISPPFWDLVFVVTENEFGIRTLPRSSVNTPENPKIDTSLPCFPFVSPFFLFFEN